MEIADSVSDCEFKSESNYCLSQKDMNMSLK